MGDRGEVSSLLARNSQTAALERMRAGQHFIGNHAQWVQIVGRLWLRLLRPRVRRVGFGVGAQCQCVEHIERLVAHGNGIDQFEAHDFRGAVVTEKYGVGTQVRVHDAMTVGVGEAVGDTGDDGPGDLRTAVPRHGLRGSIRSASARAAVP